MCCYTSKLHKLIRITKYYNRILSPLQNKKEHHCGEEKRVAVSLRRGSPVGAQLFYANDDKPNVPRANQRPPRTAGDPNFAGPSLALKSLLFLLYGERSRELDGQERRTDTHTHTRTHTHTHRLGFCMTGESREKKKLNKP